MKIILTGSTGSVGSGVLRRAIANPEITSIIALTRRPLEVKDPKLNNIIHKDFSVYDKDVVEQLKGAQACVWALGSPSGNKEIHVNYPRVAIEMFLKSLVPALPKGQPFRFVFTSGGLVPVLDYGPAVVRVRGDMDREVLALEQANAGRWESFVVRPWFVCVEPPRMRYISNAWILTDELGAAMVDAALHGSKDKIIDNSLAKKNGQAALAKQGIKL